jgi:hypothetical protein
VRATIASEGSGSRKTPSATAQTAACIAVSLTVDTIAPSGYNTALGRLDSPF